MEVNMDPLDVYKDKKVLVTGHTGFKGSWLSIWLKKLGANVIGFSLPEWGNDFLFKQTGLSSLIIDERGNITDLKRLNEVFEKHKPEIVFHLAAQPLVRQSYDEPVSTFNTNMMGTLNILECIKEHESVTAGVIITTDKVYKNKEKEEGYKEEDELGGHDPYSASKACAEIVIGSYSKSFFKNKGKYVASARAGNVIGGGDFSKDRLVPDCVKTLQEGKNIEIRNPDAVRPWQHVLEPLYGYLVLGERLLKKEKCYDEAWNFGPGQGSIVPVSKVVDLVIKNWRDGKWIDLSNPDEKKHETRLLNLDATKAMNKLGWSQKFDISKTIELVVDWYKRSETGSAYGLCIEQINYYENA